MTYAVHSIFRTVQGEGANIGRLAVFIRFAGCNLWSGREQDRASAVCKFCDTAFVGGGRFGTEALSDAAAALWPEGKYHRFAVLTGGEPLLQVDAPLLTALRDRRFSVAVETNGTQPLPGPVQWLCVSPKAGTDLALQDADELKLVYPQPGAEPERFADFHTLHRWLSPMDGPDLAANTGAAIAYCHEHPEWRLNIQAHKHWNVP